MYSTLIAALTAVNLHPTYMMKNMLAYLCLWDGQCKAAQL